MPATLLDARYTGSYDLGGRHGWIPLSMNESTTDAAAIFAPLWRRKWLLLAVGLLVAAGTYLYYKHAKRTFVANTEIYLGAGSEERVGTERTLTKTAGSAYTANQIAIIQSIIVEEVRERLRKEEDIPAVRAKVHAKAVEKSQFIAISAEARKPRAAALVANRVA